ncbi:MAG: DUF4367 domain-containing protein [Lachnospiraceae bacterium]
MISDKFIQQALQEYDTEILSTIPTESECGHTFSALFEKKMKSVIRKGNHPHLSRAIRMAASFTLVLLIAGASVLALSPTARATVTGWILGRSGSAYVYTSTGDNTGDSTMFKYTLSAIPEGYTLWVDNLNPTGGFVIYSEEETGKLLNIMYAPNEGTGALYIIPESAVQSTIPFGSTTADIYLAQTEEESSGIVWVDPNTDYLISISGFFSKEELVDMAASISIEEVERPK